MDRTNQAPVHRFSLKRNLDQIHLRNRNLYILGVTRTHHSGSQSGLSHFQHLGGASWTFLELSSLEVRFQA